MEAFAGRAGRYAKQATGYRAFIPASLPPDPPVQFDSSLLALLSQADQAIGRLDEAAYWVPNLDLFVGMYVRREAVLSSQIEGTQSTLEDLLTFELDPGGQDVPVDVEEVVNYVAAMNYGLERLATLPLSLRLLREIHAQLMRGVRGAVKQPGEFRRSQNWIGPANAPLARASYVPPPVPEMHEALDNLEKFLHQDTDLPVLIHCGLAHAQFETIHPFLDGNGRVGRLLITLLLCHRVALQQPLLYLSLYLKRHRDEYFGRLIAIREAGDWEGWLKFFLRGVQDTAQEAATVAHAIRDLREQHRALIQQHGLGVNGLRLLDLLCRWPLVNVNFLAEQIGVSFPTASKLVLQLERLGLLEETTGQQRNRRYRYTPYLALFEEPEESLQETAPLQTTESEATI